MESVVKNRKSKESLKETGTGQGKKFIINSDSDSNESFNERKRRTTHPKKIAESFFLMRIFMLIFGRIPFQSNIGTDGSFTYSWNWLSLPLVYFAFTSFVTSLVLVMGAVGFVSKMFGYSRSDQINRCQNTWEEKRLVQYTLPISINCSLIILNFAGTFYIITKGKSYYLSYFKYWNRAVRVIDMDVTDRAKVFNIMIHIEDVCTMVLLSTLYGLNVMPALFESSGAIVNAIVRLWIIDVGIPDFGEARNNLSCFKDKNNPNSPLRDLYEPTYSKEYTILNIISFVIQVYAYYGSHNFVAQFQFFSILLRNAAHIWNERLKNMLHKVREVRDDQTKRRLQLRLLMKDHLIISQLFAMTERTFGIVLKTFYFIQFALMCCELYSCIQLYKSDSCEAIFNEFDKGCDTISEAAKRLPIFDDPCNKQFIFQHAIVTMAAILVTTIKFSRTTVLASAAYEEGVKGFDILRRHGYMMCKTRKERNFVHSLVISFTRCNPIKISTGGFVINKTLIISMLSTVLSYFVIMLQFREAEIGKIEACGNNTKTNDTDTNTTTVSALMRLISTTTPSNR